MSLYKICAYVSEMSSYVSVLTIVVLLLVRYPAICHPLHLYAMSGLKRPIRFILDAWLLAFIFAIPFAIYTTKSITPSICQNPIDILRQYVSCYCPTCPSSCFTSSTVSFFLVSMLSITMHYVTMDLRIQNHGPESSIESSWRNETGSITKSRHPNAQ